MGFLKNVFNQMLAVNGREIYVKRLATNTVPYDQYSPCRAARSNYFRYASGPAETVLTGREYVIGVSSILGTKQISLIVDVAPSAGTFTLSMKINGTTQTTAPLNYNSTAGNIQTALRLLAGLANVTVTNDLVNNQKITVSFYGVMTSDQVSIDISGLTGPTTSSLATSFLGDWPQNTLRRADRLVFPDKILNIQNTQEMNDLGGDVIGFRCTTE